MENNRYTPQIIADSNKKFAIPVYQRLFAWRDKEVLKLLNDLKEHFGGDRNGSPYYLGMMTVIDNNGKYDLIDGQQRFTVMMLIASELRIYDNRWDRFLKYGDLCRLAFTARSTDNDYMQILAKNDASKGYVNNEMAAAIACIHEFLKDPETDSDKVAKKYEFDSREEVKSFAKNVFEYLTFFLAELPSEYLQHPASLNKYFEVMNSAGKGLEQHEILMVKLLHKQNNQGALTKIWNMVSQMDRPIFDTENKIKKELAEKEYLQKVKELIDDYRRQYECGLLFEEIGAEQQSSRKGQTIGEIRAKPSIKNEYLNERHEDSILSFTEFLLLVLELTPDGEKHHHSQVKFYQKNKLLSNFGYENEDDKTKQSEGLIKDVPKFFSRMLFVRYLLDYYVIRRDFADGQGIYTLACCNEDDSTAQNRLRQYQSMLYVSTEFHLWLPQFLRELMKNAPGSAAEMLNKLKRHDQTNIHRWPGKEAAENWKYKEIDRYWFWRLDYCLWDRRDKLFENNEMNNIVERYVFRENRSIEHLHPQDQTYNEQWPKDKIDSFGNLAMISQSFNSTQSNDHIQVKFARIQEQIGNKALQSIKLLKMCMDANFEHANWTPNLATQHMNKMIDILSEDIQNIENN